MLKTLRRFKTLYELASEYKDLGSLIISLLDYYQARHRCNEMTVNARGEEFRGKAWIHRLPNGLHAVTLSEPKYLRTYIITYDEIFVWRVYEKHKDFIPREHDVILDLGAFIGLYTLKHHKARRIFAIEPHPISYILLSLNIGLNKLENVEYLNKAVWSHGGYMPFYEEEFLVGGSTLIPEWRKTLHSKKFIVEAVSLDQLIGDEVIPKYIDIAKVDIEGAELEFLEGGKSCLTRGCIHRMVIELHKTVVDLRKFYYKLKEYGFKIIDRRIGHETDIIYVSHVR
jgi:FkbM family methyltransferase